MTETAVLENRNTRSDLSLQVSRVIHAERSRVYQAWTRPELIAQWYRRNFLICANLVQRLKPGDRAVVFYGSGHAFLLRQCMSEMPGYKLVEANDYLPK